LSTRRTRTQRKKLKKRAEENRTQTERGERATRREMETKINLGRTLEKTTKRIKWSITVAREQRKKQRRTKNKASESVQGGDHTHAFGRVGEREKNTKQCTQTAHQTKRSGRRTNQNDLC
jgi:hypothetical protein